MSFKLESELSEDQIESDVSSYLGYITPLWARRFRLISADEPTTGADKLFNRFLPIYLQFKVSQGLNPTASILQRFQNKPLANIIDFRKSNNLSGNPILYFQLRRKAVTATDFQHNILASLNTPPTQYSLYVAPLTLGMVEYEKQLSYDWYLRFFQFNPFINRETELHDSFLQKKLILGLNPFLRNHISIPPHANVSTHHHHYSYSRSAGDVAWHGGELLNGDFRLSTQMSQIFNSFYFDRNLGVSFDQYIGFIRGFKFDNYRRIEDELYANNDPFTLVQAFGRILKKEFNITLLLLTESLKAQ
ncbi:MAG TPA: hypothetical protein VF622_04940 [Segetibacter sp.]